MNRKLISKICVNVGGVLCAASVFAMMEQNFVAFWWLFIPGAALTFITPLIEHKGI